MNNVSPSITFRGASLIYVLFIISACVSGPREVNASLPLVTSSLQKPDKDLIPKRFWATLSDSSQSQLSHEQYKITLGGVYISALGVFCRELLVEDNNEIKKRIACENHFINENNKQDKAWFLEKVIIESSSYVEL